MKIYLDVDGVVANLNGKMDSLLTVHTETVYDWPIRYDKPWKYIKAIYNKLDFYNNVRHYDYVPELFRLLKSFNCEIIFVTSHANCPLATASKMIWLGSLFPEISYELLSDKHLLDYNDAILIDDRDNAGKIQYTWPQPHNKNAGRKGLEDLQDILKEQGQRLLDFSERRKA